MPDVTYIAGAELPDLAITWRASNGDVIDFSSGWTFTVKVGKPWGEAEIVKTNGVTGAAAAPNVTVAWAAGELDGLDPGDYDLEVLARRMSDNKDRAMKATLRIAAALTLPTP